MADDSVRKAFAAWDKNGDGFIDRSEIREVRKRECVARLSLHVVYSHARACLRYLLQQACRPPSSIR
jgi:hypothetical protein